MCGGERASGLRRSTALRAMMAAIEKSVALVFPSSATILSPPDFQHSAFSTSIKHLLESYALQVPANHHTNNVRDIVLF